MSRRTLTTFTTLLALTGATTLGAQHAPSAHPTHAAAGKPAKGGATKASAFKAPAGSRLVTVVARDFAFELPDSIPAGLTTFLLKNEGPELHHVYMVKLEQGKTVSDAMAAFKAGGPPPAWAKMIGGPNAPAPGAESNATLTLEPGSYMLFCVIPSPDGTPHIMKGMVRPLTVTASARKAPAPVADVTITLDDYGFAFSKPIAAGQRTIRLENAATQNHEMFLVRLAPGKTPMDVIQWIDKPNGPPPGEPLGGITDIPHKGHIYIQRDFAPGEYGLICFSPDHKDGKPHFVHGMVKQFSVK